jgi:hypothetical protein
MKAYVCVHKFAQAMGENPETELPPTEADVLVLDLSDQVDAARIKTYEHSYRALSCLAVSFMTTGAMVHYIKGVSIEWPNGRSNDVVACLMKTLSLLMSTKQHCSPSNSRKSRTQQ